MAITKKINTLTLQDLALLASDIIVGAIQQKNFEVVKVSSNDCIMIKVQNNAVRLYYDCFKQEFSSHAMFDDLTKNDSLRCYLSITKSMEAFSILMDRLLEGQKSAIASKLEDAEKVVSKIKAELLTL